MGEHANKLEAIVAAARSRFVPIAMTSLATIIGLVPTAMGLEHGSEANQPLALAVVGGLTSSTILSLFLVPVMFLFFAKPPTPMQVEDMEHSAPQAEAEALA
jgi:multidrug efflux pump subunit AcrB